MVINTNARKAIHNFTKIQIKKQIKQNKQKKLQE